MKMFASHVLFMLNKLFFDYFTGRLCSAAGGREVVVNKRRLQRGADGGVQSGGI